MSTEVPMLLQIVGFLHQQALMTDIPPEMKHDPMHEL